MAFGHIGFSVTNFPAGRTFYAAALAPLGWTIQMEGDAWAMMGPEGKRAFWFGAAALAGPPPAHMHLAIAAPDGAAVNAFHVAALAAGGADNGAPGLRLMYHPDYYAAFITDLNGHNLEAVCHAPGSIA